MIAAEYGQHEVAKLLLDNDAQVDLQNKVMSGDGWWSCGARR